MRRQNNEYRNRPNVTRPPSPASADSKDGSVERSSDSGSGLMRDSRITSRWAQKTFNCVSPSEDLIGHGSLVSDVKNSVQPSSDTGSGLMPNSRITSRSAQKTFNCVSPSEDLISVQPSSGTGSGGMRNSRITSKSAQKTFNCVSPSEDLISVQPSSGTGSGGNSRITSKSAHKTFNCVSPSEDLISVQPSSDTGGGLMRDSRITSRWAQNMFNCVSPSEDLIGHGSLVSDVKNSVQPSSNTGSGLMPNSRITSRSAQKTFNCVSPSEDLIGRGSLVSDVNSSVQPSSHTGSGVKRNSRTASRSAQKTLNCVSPSEDLIVHGSLVSDVKSLTSGIEGLNLSAYSRVESDESGKEYVSPHLKKASPIASSNLNEIFHREGHQDEESSAKESGLKSKVVSYDICPPRPGSVIVLKTPLHEKNKQIRNEKKRNIEGNTISILRPGMILLKSYLSFTDQVKLVSTCRNLGMKPGGFYQPGYRDGAELNLKMMCLGKIWDPEKGYVDIMPTDGTSPPFIPDEFSQLVKRVLKDSHAHLKEKHKNKNVEDILPSMTPNICIVNFYTASGRLGLHQDKDESSQSLEKGLPVVSFSVGDSAEFLYSDQRDVFQAEKVVLKSGDVLIFGGKARRIYHGVSAINPNTAPKSLLEETNLRPGRLNLTFREY